MLNIDYRSARLAAALAVLAAIVGCTAALDFGSLSTEPPKDAAPDVAPPKDAGFDFDVVDSYVPPPDTGTCIPGDPCDIPTLKGECRKGKKVCTEAGNTICQQVVQAGADADETCNNKDTDCDGIGDAFELAANAKCGPNRQCNGVGCVPGCQFDVSCVNGNKCDKARAQCRCGTRSGCSGQFQCTNGVCLCGTAPCGPGEGCSNGHCTCGSISQVGRICTGANPRCVNDTACGCDGDSTCNANETCDSGRCNCGTSVGNAAGPFCNVGTCNSTTGMCSGGSMDSTVDTTRDTGTSDTSVDASVDTSVDTTVDTTSPDTSVDSTVDGSAG